MERKIINILYIEDFLDPTTGGVQRVTMTLANYLKDYGVNSFFCYSEFDYKPIGKKYKLQLNIHSDDINYIYNAILDFVIKNNISIIIVQDIAIKQIQYCLGRLRKEHDIKIIYCFHRNPISSKQLSFNLYYRLKVQIYNFIYKIKPKYDFIDIIDAVDRYIVLSPSYIDAFKKEYKIFTNEKFEAIPNPVPFEPAALDLGSKEKTVLIITRFQERVKNIKKAIDIWKYVEAKNKDWQLIVGGYGKDYEDVYNYFLKKKLRRCKFVGKVDNPKELYNKASIFMMTSRHEGYPMVLLEAMEYGCVPIVYDSFTSVHDIIENGKNGLIIKPYSTKKYIRGIINLARNNNIREMIARNAYNTIINSNTKEAICLKWIELFKSL